MLMTQEDPFKRTFKGVCAITLVNHNIEDIIEAVVTTLRTVHAKETRRSENSLIFKGHTLPVIEWNAHDLWIDGGRKGSPVVAGIVTEFMGLDHPCATDHNTPVKESQEWLYKGPTFASSSSSEKTLNDGEFHFTQGSDCVLHNWLSLDVLMDWAQVVLGSPLVKVSDGLFKCSLKGRSGKIMLQMTTTRGVIQITGNPDERRERMVRPLMALFRSWERGGDHEVFFLSIILCPFAVF